MKRDKRPKKQQLDSIPGFNVLTVMRRPAQNPDEPDDVVVVFPGPNAHLVDLPMEEDFERLSGLTQGRIVLDLSQVMHMGSLYLGRVIKLDTQTRINDKSRLQLITSPGLRELLSIVHLDRLIEIV